MPVVLSKMQRMRKFLEVRGHEFPRRVDYGSLNDDLSMKKVFFFRNYKSNLIFS